MSKYGGMTVNERLWVSGLMDKFYLAVSEKDINASNLYLGMLKWVRRT